MRRISSNTLAWFWVALPLLGGVVGCKMEISDLGALRGQAGASGDGDGGVAGTPEGQGLCGDGVIDDGENCDDGNAAPGDGCGSDCQVESGWLCEVSRNAPTVCVVASTCGNGILEGDEDCDDGAVNNDSGPCATDCRVTNGCGDGSLRDDEACDDGNTASGDGCSGACQIEVGWTCSMVLDVGRSSCDTECGDGIVVGTEECDDGEANGVDSACSLDCGLAHPVCGNGNVETSEGETCDDANTDSEDGCSFDCQVEEGWVCSIPGGPCVESVCGDGVVAGDSHALENTAEAHPDWPQNSAAPQAVPQPPQWFTSMLVSTHPSLQQVSPSTHSTVSVHAVAQTPVSHPLPSTHSDSETHVTHSSASEHAPLADPPYGVPEVPPDGASRCAMIETQVPIDDCRGPHKPYCGSHWTIRPSVHPACKSGESASHRVAVNL